MTLSDFIEELEIAIKQDGHDIYCTADTAKMIKKYLLLNSQYFQQKEMLEILADVLDGCPLTYPCDKLWKPTGWCEKHCKDGQAEPSKECWLKYAEVMVKRKV